MNKEFKESFEHESKRKMPKSETEIRVGTRCYREGRKTMGWRDMLPDDSLKMQTYQQKMIKNVDVTC
jgi:hypothetical protein